ncbi:MAG: hypothetical protein JO331_05040 [Verrucomicrobia bacterium]|nr:hypothetical protein [Verrucomicrobiota bacterium]
MESFNYLSVLLSIVIGLAITQVLQGLRQLILTRTKVKLYLPTLVWAALALLIAIQGWWASFSMHMRANWTFLALLVVILQAIAVYMVAALVLPDVNPEKVVDLREHYFAHRRWFFGALLATTLFSLAKGPALNGRFTGGLDLLFHVIFSMAALAAMLTGWEWLHRVLTPIMALIFIVYIAVLFARL